MNNIQPNTNLLDYLPDWYKPVLDYQEILNAEIPSYQSAASYLAQIHENMSLDEMGTSGCEEWEKIFQIPVLPTDTLQDRRDRIKNRLWLHPPFSERYIRQRLDQLIGENLYTLTVENNNYRIVLSAVNVAQTFDSETIRFLNTVKPAHIILDIIYLFNKWGYIGGAVINASWVQGTVSSSGNTSGSSTRCRTGPFKVGAFGIAIKQSGTTYTFTEKWYSNLPATSANFISNGAEWESEPYTTADDATYYRAVIKYPTDAAITPPDITGVDVLYGKAYKWGDMTAKTWLDAREDDTL